jgi:zinc transport system ATP-binding protein
MSKPIVTIEELFFSYDQTPVLQNVNLTIAEGEFIGIFGPNGGGKTTLLRLMMGMLRPQKGKISFFGLPPQKVGPQIGYVPQVAHFDKDFPISVFDVVIMGRLSKLKWWGKFKKEDRIQAEAALKAVGLLDLATRPFKSLSGGQAQRVLIARAIAGEPKILLLDEPTASVDPQAEQEIYQLLQTLNQTMTIVMVTHDLQTIIDRAQRLFCVHHQVTMLKAKEVCEHFALGLYHTPLTSKEHFLF